MKVKLLAVMGLFLQADFVQAVTLELAVKNNCSGGFVAHVACSNAMYTWRGAPYAKTEPFTIGSLKPGDDCLVNNLWDTIGFGAVLTRNANVKILKETGADDKVKAAVVFENRGFLRVCSPVVTEVIAQ